MAGSGRIKRKLFRLVVTILTLTLVAIISGAAFLWFRYSARQAAATGYFKTKPALEEDFQTNAYGITTFIPLLGQQTPLEPITYGEYRVMAGVTKTGSGVIMQLAENGTSSWSVDLNAPLTACARQPIGGKSGDNRFLPCLYRSGNGSGIAMVDLKMGTAKWIWESSDYYVNIATEGTQIVLVGDDLSLLRLSEQGEQLTEGLTSQKPSDPQFQPDVGGCSLDGNPTREAPESFETFSQTLWVIGHKGINYLVDPETNQIQVASPGRIIRNADDTAWALSPKDGCVRSFFIQPQRGHVSVLPEGTTVPADNSGHLTEMVQKGGKLFRMDWTTLRSLRAVFNDSEMKLQTGSQILQTPNALYIASNKELECYSRKNGAQLWSFSENVKDLRIYQDILLYTTENGQLKAVSTADGIELWSQEISENSRLEPIKDTKQIRTLSPQGLRAWGVHSQENYSIAKGAANPITPAEPGLTFPVDSCIRVSNVDGSGSSYQVNFSRVSCKLEGAEKIVRVIDTGQIERGKTAKDYISKCLEDYKATSAITVTSAIADPKISALCTGQVATGTTQVPSR
ncbi:MAG: PQQ-binding-like beta-propeller repeat protein [Varibaculum timonense]